MIESTCLVFLRSGLNERYKDVPINEITLQHINHEFKKCMEQPLVIFIDDTTGKGETAIIKNRWGSLGVVS